MSYESEFREEFPAEYERIHEIVPTMPDIRSFESEAVKSKISKWNDDNRWRYLLLDYETLKSAKQRGEEDYLELFHELQQISNKKNNSSYRERMREIDKILNPENMYNFVNTYPAISWVETMIDSAFRKYAIMGGYFQWINDLEVPLTSEEKMDLAIIAPNREIVDFLLNSVNLERTKNSDYLYSLASRERLYPSIAFYDYILDNDLLTDMKKGKYIIKIMINFGNSDLIKKIIKKFPSTTWKNYAFAIKNAAEKNVKNLDLFVNAGLDLKGVKSEVLETLIKNNNLELIKKLIQLGVKIEADFYLDDPLYIAMENNNIPMIDYFLSLGVSPYRPYDDSYTAESPSAFARSVEDPDIFYHLYNVLKHIPTDQIGEAMKMAIDSGTLDILETLFNKYKQRMEKHIKKHRKH